MSNRYIETYIDGYIKPFRRLCNSKYSITIYGLVNFIEKENNDLPLLLEKLREYDFEVKISGKQDTSDIISVEYDEDDSHKNFKYQIENLISILQLSCDTRISTVGILVMQILSKIVCRAKTMYKAIILDLDDTLWKGTLAEEGIDSIKQRLSSDEALPYVRFMRFIRRLGEELGLYIAICSHNDIETVETAVERLDEQGFPLKGHIDVIVANHNDKSFNIKAIAEKLSIMTNSCVFIDDNPRVREEVRQNLPEVFVPDWKSHDELYALFASGCIFNRFELSIRNRKRKWRNEGLKIERMKAKLPCLPVKANEDINHHQAKFFYAHSNQFKFTDKGATSTSCQSLFFDLYSEGGENYGTCSTITYEDTAQGIHVLNWIMSCGYFEFGIEEYILLYLLEIADGRPISFTFNNTGKNNRAIALVREYQDAFTEDLQEEDCLHFQANTTIIERLQANTNLKKYCDG